MTSTAGAGMRLQIERLREERMRRDGHATGMAGEFFAMEKLFRLGHEPALTLGNAKSVDILLRKADGALREISVKSICGGGGKWCRRPPRTAEI